MQHENLYIVTQIAMAFGAFLVAFIAIWGERIRDVVVGPKLELKLLSERGELTTRGGARTIYWTIKVENRRRGSLARNVRVLCKRIEKQQEDNSFIQVPPSVPVQLKWTFREYPEYFSNITDEDYCDFGFLTEGKDSFVLGLILFPNNFQGKVYRGEAMKLYLTASAENCPATEPYILLVCWDGTWTDNCDKMKQHLIICEM